MVADLPAPHRPLRGGRAWTWAWREPGVRHPWAWCRIYHRSAHTPDGVTARTFGPLHRMDPHLPGPGGRPGECPQHRSVLYVAGNLATGFAEVFGDLPAAAVCPGYRVALVRPVTPLRVLDLRSQGAAMRVGALPSLATGAYPRARTQEWARAIYEDQPVPGATVHGVYYDAAHTGGPALALWDTQSRIRVVNDGNGTPQDFPLVDPRVWPRVVAAAVDLGLRADLTGPCRHCI